MSFKDIFIFRYGEQESKFGQEIPQSHTGNRL